MVVVVAEPHWARAGLEHSVIPECQGGTALEAFL